MKHTEPRITSEPAPIDSTADIDVDVDYLEREKTGAWAELIELVDDVMKVSDPKLSAFRNISKKDQYDNAIDLRRDEISAESGNVEYLYKMHPEVGAENYGWKRTVSWNQLAPGRVVAYGVHEGEDYHYELGPEKIDEVREEITELFGQEQQEHGKTVRAVASKFGHGVLEAGSKLVDRLKPKK